MDADPEAVVTAAYDAVSQRDLDSLERLVDPEIEIIDPDLPGGGSFRGLEGARQFVQQWLDAFEDLEVRVERLVRTGSQVVACVRQIGRSVGGVPVELRDGHVWTVVGGRATRLEMYLSHNAALEAARAD